MNDENKVIANNFWSSKCVLILKYTLSRWFYLHIILLITLSIIQLRFSVVYKDHCTIDSRIIRHLLVIGIIQILYSFNGIVLVIFCLLYGKYQCFYILILIDFVIQQILVVFLIVWFIIGNYLVFHIKNVVQYTNSYSTSTYCDYTLYQTAFWTNIIYYILLVLFSITLVFTNIKWFIKHFKRLKPNCIKTSVESE
jgi:hypothetical protein